MWIIVATTNILNFSRLDVYDNTEHLSNQIYEFMNFFKKLKLHTSLALTRFFSKLGNGKLHYLFAYFHNNCDGKLYYAHSTDGLKREYLADGFLKADNTTGHCFRDPFIYKGREEHICVWTASVLY